MSKAGKLFFILCLMGIGTHALAANSLPSAEPSEVGVSDERLERITQTFQRKIDEGSLPGVVINIAREGKLVYEKSLGWQDAEAKIPMTTESIFRIYSMTKPIVSVAAMTLVESGHLSLLDPIDKYIPAFSDMNVGIEAQDESGEPTLRIEKAEIGRASCRERV